MIYFAQNAETLNIKIGCTMKEDVELRIKDGQTWSSSKLVLLATRPGDQEMEKKIHSQFSAARLEGEWFRPIPQLILFIIGCAAVKVAYEAVLGVVDQIAYAPLAELEVERQSNAMELLARIEEQGYRPMANPKTGDVSIGWIKVDGVIQTTIGRETKTTRIHPSEKEQIDKELAQYRDILWPILRDQGKVWSKK